MRKTLLFASLLCVLISTYALGVGGDMGGADPNGSAEYPYLIEDLADFDEFASNSTYWASGVHTKLMTDIDLSGRTYTTAVIAPDTSTSNGFQGTTFTGLFEGNNKTISGFMVNQPNNSYIAIFGYIETGGAVRNLKVTDISIVGYDFVACLAGFIIDNVSIENCNAVGTLDGNGYTVGGLIGGAYTNCAITTCQSIVEVHAMGHSVGGLIGANWWNSVVMNCHSQATVSGDWANLGGLVGDNYLGTIINCSSTGIVFMTAPHVDSVGGLAGNSDGGLISSCWVNSQTTGRYWVGGLVGNSSSPIENSYSTGQVNGNSEIGGLIGANSGTVIECYSNCSINGLSYLGGLLGLTSKDTINSFWDVEGSGIDTAYILRTGWSYPYVEDPVYSTPGIAEGKTTAEMMTQITFAGWDFVTDWMMLRPGEDYPRLAWQEVFAGDIAGLYGADMVDFAYAANYWGLTGCNSGTDCGRADIDASGDVGLGDMAGVAADWVK